MGVNRPPPLLFAILLSHGQVCCNSSHRVFGGLPPHNPSNSLRKRPLLLRPPGLPFNNFLGILSAGIFSTCPSHLN
uniref:Putative secreted protein n=1 Tax=Panstrongylus lignarius TaxID=156445 RepID=A0A224Y545_9HEMI